MSGQRRTIGAESAISGKTAWFMIFKLTVVAATIRHRRQGESRLSKVIARLPFTNGTTIADLTQRVAAFGRTARIPP